MTDDETEALKARMEAESRAEVERGRQYLADEPKRIEADIQRMLELQAERERGPESPKE